jgi:hypothetical protein
MIDAKFEALLFEQAGEIGSGVVLDFTVFLGIEDLKFWFRWRGQEGNKGGGIAFGWPISEALAIAIALEEVGIFKLMRGVALV